MVYLFSTLVETNCLTFSIDFSHFLFYQKWQQLLLWEGWNFFTFVWVFKMASWTPNLKEWFLPFKEVYFVGCLSFCQELDGITPLFVLRVLITVIITALRSVTLKSTSYRFKWVGPDWKFTIIFKILNDRHFWTDIAD